MYMHVLPPSLPLSLPPSLLPSPNSFLDCGAMPLMSMVRLVVRDRIGGWVMLKLGRR